LTSCSRTVPAPKTRPTVAARRSGENDLCSCSRSEEHLPPRQEYRYHRSLFRPDGDLRPAHLRPCRQHRQMSRCGRARLRPTPQQRPQADRNAVEHRRRPTCSTSWRPAAAAPASRSRPSRSPPRRAAGWRAGCCWRCTGSGGTGRYRWPAAAPPPQLRLGWLKPSRSGSSTTSGCTSGAGMAPAAPTNPCTGPSSRRHQNLARRRSAVSKWGHRSACHMADPVVRPRSDRVSRRPCSSPPRGPDMGREPDSAPASVITVEWSLVLPGGALP
jgi:hypothetical protein